MDRTDAEVERQRVKRFDELDYQVKELTLALKKVGQFKEGTCSSFTLHRPATEEEVKQYGMDAAKLEHETINFYKSPLPMKLLALGMESAIRVRLAQLEDEMRAL